MAKVRNRALKPKAFKPPSAEDLRTVKRGEMLAWIERMLADSRVTMPDDMRAEGAQLITEWKWRQRP